MSLTSPLSCYLGHYYYYLFNVRFIKVNVLKNIEVSVPCLIFGWLAPYNNWVSHHFRFWNRTCLSNNCLMSFKSLPPSNWSVWSDVSCLTTLWRVNKNVMLYGVFWLELLILGCLKNPNVKWPLSYGEYLAIFVHTHIWENIEKEK